MHAETENETHQINLKLDIQLPFKIFLQVEQSITF